MAPRLFPNPEPVQPMGAIIPAASRSVVYYVHWRMHPIASSTQNNYISLTHRQIRSLVFLVWTLLGPGFTQTPCSVSVKSCLDPTCLGLESLSDPSSRAKYPQLWLSSIEYPCSSKIYRVQVTRCINVIPRGTTSLLSTYIY